MPLRYVILKMFWICSYKRLFKKRQSHRDTVYHHTYYKYLNYHCTRNCNKSHQIFKVSLCKQKLQTLIRRCVLWRLILFCIACQFPIKEKLDIYGLRNIVYGQSYFRPYEDLRQKINVHKRSDTGTYILPNLKWTKYTVNNSCFCTFL